MSENNGSELLAKIFKVFLSAPDRPLNFSEICEAVKGDNRISAMRKEIKGAFQILEALGIVSCVYNRPTTKLWRLRDPIAFNRIGQRASEIFTSTKNESINKNSNT